MAASYGAAIFNGRSGRKYYKDIYLSDSAGALVNWDGGSGAGSTSPNKWLIPEDMVLVDVVIQAATGQTKTQIIRNGIPTGDMIRNSINLSTITTRPVLTTPFKAGDEVSMIQLT